MLLDKKYFVATFIATNEVQMPGFVQSSRQKPLSCGKASPTDILRVCPKQLFASEERSFVMPKRTFQPNRRRRSKTHGFRSRMKTKSGRAVISRRRAKGRKRVAVKPGFRE